MGPLRRGCGGRRPRGSDLTPRLARPIRFAAAGAPAIAAIVYASVLVRRLPDIVSQLTWNSDYVSGMVMAQSIGTAGKSGRAIAIQPGWFWYDLATLHLPFHVQVWEYTPFAMAMVALALITWTAWRLAGPFAGVLAVSIGLGASPLVLATQLAQSYHDTTWLGAAVLAAYLCLILTGELSRIATIAVSSSVALLVGYATATDPLLVAAGDAPFVLTLAAMWWLRRSEVSRDRFRSAAATAAGIAVAAGTLLLANRLAGFGSSFPRGLTHLVSAQHVQSNAQLLVSGIFEVAGMPHEGSALGLVLGVILVAAVLAPIAWLIRSRANGMSPGLLAVTGFWIASTLSIAAAFFFSDIPADFLDNSSRYLVPMFYAAAATVPLWAAAGPVRAALVAVPAVVLILANASSVEQAAASRAFEPSFGRSLIATIAFLEQHELHRGYAAYEFAAPMTWKSDFALGVYPATQVFIVPDDQCGQSGPGAVCPFAYNSVSDWYSGDGGPTFILVAPGVARLGEPPPPGLDTVMTVYRVGDYSIYVYADDVAAHMGTTRKFTRPLF